MIRCQHLSDNYLMKLLYTVILVLRNKYLIMRQIANDMILAISELAFYHVNGYIL